ncbi:hypothetical protein N7X38_001825 [Escherichia coli]|nr:hypothetical protein [Escherichia coli]
MTALNKQALIAKIIKQNESFDTVVLKEDEANALLDELESQQTFQQAFFRQSLMYDVVAEAYEEAKEQIAKDVEIKARLCLESNSLFDRLRAAEKRIAELEARTKPIGFSASFDDGMCRDYAWRYVKEAITPDGWTVGDNITYFGFFCWGWDMRRQYNEQRPVVVTLPRAMYTEFEDDDYCREVVVLERQKVIDCLTAAGIGVKGE